MKKFIPYFLLSFVTFYMLFFFEPIILYSGNYNEFYFDLQTILPSNIFLTIFFTFLFVFFYWIIFFLSKKKKWKNLMSILFFLHFICFLVLYIHGNFLSVRLDLIDGTEYILKNHIRDVWISIFVILILSVLVVFGIKKFGYSKMIRFATYVTCTVFLMLTSGWIMAITRANVLEKKVYKTVVTTSYLNTYSKEGNFIIYVVDSVDSQVFEKVRMNSPYKDLFQDFTYYPDTMSGYNGTRNSVPQMLTGMWDDNSYYYADYSKKAYKQSPLFQKLRDEKYDMNFYGDLFIMDYPELKQFSNFSFFDDSIDTFALFKEEGKYILYKYFPFFLKQIVDINSFNLNGKNISGVKEEYYDWSNPFLYQFFSNRDIEIVSNKQFKYIHTEGSHTPFHLTADLEEVKDATYEEKVEASLKVFHCYLERLKENDLYDQSIIIFMADHGYSELPNFWGRQNPVFLVKGIEENHKMQWSDKKVSYADLMDAYLGLIDGKKSDELFLNLSDDRTRRFLFYPDNYDKTIEEYIQTSNAWNVDTLQKTGKIFRPHNGISS